MKRASLISLFILAFLPAAAVAQVQPGTPPFGSYGGGPDVINLANLNSRITVPVLSKAGRGIPFTFSLTQDSSVWFPVTSNGSTSWQPVANWGWNQSVARIGSISNHVGISSRLRPCGDFQAFITTTTYSSFAYHDGFGASHPFPGGTTVIYNSCDDSTTTSSDQGAASDGSGYTFSVTGDTVTQLLGPDGSNINPATGAGSIQDRNGNLVSISNNGVVTDTLGQTALTLGGSGTPTSPNTFTYPAPSSANAVYTEKYTTQTVQTNFGCSGIAEFGPFSESLVSEIDLPDGSKYTFTYEGTPGHAGNVTGRLTSVTLPTGGTISYSYSGGSNGIVCADGTTATLTRQTPDGTWKYAHSESGAAWTTTITDPQGNNTVLNFQGIYQTEQQVYSGTSTLLKTVFTCYNGAAPNCNSTAVSLPITQRAVFTQWPGGQESETNTFFTGFGGMTEEDDYDYGSGAPGILTRKTLVTYASLGNNILDRPASITVENGSGAIVAQTTVGYDAGTVVATSGTPQHVAISGSRGNATSVSSLVQGTTSLTKNFTYFDTGTVQTATDVNGAQTTFNYGTASCGNSFPTSVAEPLSMSKSMTWNCNGGVETSATDENGQPTTYTYNDPGFWRIAQVGLADGGQTNYSYNDIPPFSVTATRKVNSSANMTMTAIRDALGRTKQTQLTSDPQGTDYVDTTYDSVGRVYSVSNPYRSTSDPTYGLTKYSYDALSRPTQVIDADGSAATTSYSSNCVTATDEQGKNREGCTDALGRLTTVIENPGGLGYQTNYTYDALGNLLTVSENGSRSRTFTYDDLSRLTSAANPESGIVTYIYDTSTKGDLYTKKDARSITTTYTYDALHRLTQKSYSDGLTPSVFFAYDGPTNGFGVPATNLVGRLDEEWTGTSCCGTTAEIFSYDPMGRVLLNEQYTSTMSYRPVNYTYDLVGNLLTASNGFGVTISYGYDGASRPIGVSSSLVDSQHPASLATVNAYDPAGQISQMTFGNMVTGAQYFNAQLQPCRINVNTSGSPTNGCTGAGPSGNILDMEFNWNGGSSDNGNVVGWGASGSQTFNRTFTYDALNRLASMSDSDSVASCQGLTWGYDAWGNRTAQTPTKGACGQWSVSYSAQNQVSGYTYDASGNVVNDGLHTYTYDAENRVTQVDGGATATYVYDAEGRRARKTVGGTNIDRVHDLSDNVVAEYYGTGWGPGYVYLGGQLIAEYSNSTTYFVHGDHLGSTRLMTAMNQSVYDSMDYLPFGEQIAGGTGTTHKFTGYERDAESGLDNAMFRYNSSTQGRFMSPDPYNFGANVASPQSWNGYAYVLNSPLTFVDPSGLYGDIPYDPAPIPFDSFAYSGIPVYGVSPDLNSWLGVTPISSSLDLQGAYGIPTIGLGTGLFGPQDPQSPQNPTPTIGPQHAPQPSPAVPKPSLPGCFALSQKVALQTFTGLDIPTMPAGSELDDGARSAASAAAGSYAMQRGLAYPLRSSIVRGILGFGETVAVTVLLAPVVYAEIKGLAAEIQAERAGTCQPVGHP